MDIILLLYFTIIITVNKFSRISEWFASNIFLLDLAVVVPLFSSAYNFGFFVSYNAVYTICHLLYVIILIKHNFVTRYVFYISVCMIFAYLESSIVAVFYFALTSEGSLNNLKLTALRSVAIGVTLKVSSVLPCTSYLLSRQNHCLRDFQRRKTNLPEVIFLIEFSGLYGLIENLDN